MRQESTFWYVSVMHKGREWYAIRGNKPTILAKPENRCLFNKPSKARELKKFFDLESTFDKIELKSVTVK